MNAHGLLNIFLCVLNICEYKQVINKDKFAQDMLPPNTYKYAVPGTSIMLVPGNARLHIVPQEGHTW